MKELETRLTEDGHTVSDRMYINWAVLMAAFRTLEVKIPMPMNYAELFRVCIEKLIEQNRVFGHSDELAVFWDYVQVLYQESRISLQADFKILHEVSSIKTESGLKTFDGVKNILIIRERRILQHYAADKSRVEKQLCLSSEDMRQYLEKSDEFIGVVKRKFHKLDKFGGTELVDGKISLVSDRAMAFDLGKLVAKYGLYVDDENSNGERRSDFDHRDAKDECPF